MGTDRVRVNVVILGETPGALRVAQRGVARPAVCWLPRRELSVAPEHACVGDSVELTLPRWLASKTGFSVEG
jgi:hypothetical protein